MLARYVNITLGFGCRQGLADLYLYGLRCRPNLPDRTC